MKPIPTTNVNQKPCASWCPVTHVFGETTHDTHCPGKPVPIPCPIPPSVTFTVRLGECGPGCTPVHTKDGSSAKVHALDCPVRPIRVSCSISGKTWEESDAVDPEGVGEDGRLVGFTFASPVHAACGARWALVKALVLGRMRGGVLNPPLGPVELFARRDAVFAALARLTRAEEEYYEARDAALKPINGHTIMRPESHNRPSAHDLAAYVTSLIEQVGILEGGQ